MKKKIIIAVLVLATVSFVVGFFSPKEDKLTKIYFVDASIQRLIPTEYSLKQKSTQASAEFVIKKLLEGQDENNKIARIIPRVKNGLSVNMKGRTAVVNMTEEFVKNHSSYRAHEILTVYQIVNSLTELEGIDNVKFTIDDKIKKDFKGFIDMRETFIPDYYV